MKRAVFLLLFTFVIHVSAETALERACRMDPNRPQCSKLRDSKPSVQEPVDTEALKAACIKDLERTGKACRKLTALGIAVPRRGQSSNPQPDAEIRTAPPPPSRLIREETLNDKPTTKPRPEVRNAPVTHRSETKEPTVTRDPLPKARPIQEVEIRTAPPPREPDKYQVFLAASKGNDDKAYPRREADWPEWKAQSGKADALFKGRSIITDKFVPMGTRADSSIENCVREKWGSEELDEEVVVKDCEAFIPPGSYVRLGKQLVTEGYPNLEYAYWNDSVSSCTEIILPDEEHEDKETLATFADPENRLEIAQMFRDQFGEFVKTAEASTYRSHYLGSDYTPEGREKIEEMNALDPIEQMRLFIDDKEREFGLRKGTLQKCFKSNQGKKGEQELYSRVEYLMPRVKQDPQRECKPPNCELIPPNSYVKAHEESKKILAAAIHQGTQAAAETNFAKACRSAPVSQLSHGNLAYSVVNGRCVVKLTSCGGKKSVPTIKILKEVVADIKSKGFAEDQCRSVLRQLSEDCSGPNQTASQKLAAIRQNLKAALDSFKPPSKPKHPQVNQPLLECVMGRETGLTYNPTLLAGALCKRSPNEDGFGLGQIRSPTYASDCRAGYIPGCGNPEVSFVAMGNDPTLQVKAVAGHLSRSFEDYAPKALDGWGNFIRHRVAGIFGKDLSAEERLFKQGIYFYNTSPKYYEGIKRCYDCLKGKPLTGTPSAAEWDCLLKSLDPPRKAAIRAKRKA